MAEARTQQGSAFSYRWIILIFGILAYTTSQFARQNYGGIQKFIAADFNLDRAALGLLGSVFFYAYALFQMPWGIASDRFGNRGVTSLGLFLIAATMLGFATSQSEGALLFWRGAAGIASAAVYVAMAGALARWFPPGERGFSQSTFAGVGGAAGESAAFFLLPVLAIYFASGWRSATNWMAAAIAVTAAICFLFLRSAPPASQATTKKPFPLALIGDLRLWCYAVVYMGFIIGVRNAQAWTAIYVTDVYMVAHGRDLNAAVVAGGLLAMVAYSLIGRGVGVPAAGRFSDALVKRGVSRMALVFGWLTVIIALFHLLSTLVTTMWVVAVAVCVLSVAVNSFPLITASVSETYGPDKTASVFGFINMMGQLAGATVLAASGYLGIALSGGERNSLAEYQGIWLAGMTSVAITTVIGGAMYMVVRHRAPAPAVAPSVP
ncbi:MAG TPA: MFS transporter [Vicinamibacterales bacterium]